MKKPQLIKSTSGIRGIVGNGLDSVLVTQYGAAFGTFLKKGKVVLGSDTRPSGEVIRQAVISGLLSVGLDVVDLGIVPTPTVEIAVKGLKAAGGICVTASHNPTEWNALKFFNSTGEFITPAEYKKLNKVFESNRFAFKDVTQLGKLSADNSWVGKHIKKTLVLKTIIKAAIRKAGEGIIHINDESNKVISGDAIEISPGSTQWIENQGSVDLEFLCIVDPAWQVEDEEILE